MKELSAEDPAGFRNFVHIDKHDFNELLQKVTLHIKRQDTRLREAISPAERLALTLRYLASGSSF